MNKIEKLTINGVSYAICDPDAARVQDEAVGENTWSSQKILDTFAPKFTAEGNLVKCRSVGDLTVTAQESAAKIFRTGKNLYDFSQTVVRITSMMSSTGPVTTEYFGHILQLPAGAYTMSVCPGNVTGNTYLYGKVNTKDGQWKQDVVLTQAKNTYTVSVTLQPEDILILYNAYKGEGVNSGNALFHGKYYVQIESGDQATEYEAFRGGEFAPGESIPSLPGDNVIWADQGPVTVSGWEDPVAKIRQLEAALGG